ncbi:DUF4054 domain-containing protein [Euryhalocaulis caribicus]|uniref:DUF4054 domain-containing protein n=1 Tax=Euryhalocaulis caribicus TaxID=1161401 RepID=UPI00039CA100|nr:DUF4054 domain-containing protein [Euryhalocaulis caribicus]
MAYVQPDAAAFQVRFPSFASVDGAVITAALSRARRTVDDSWLEDDRAEAEMLHAAHDLTLEGIGATREAQLAGFKRLKLGSLELERQAGDGSTSAFASTTYGQKFLALMRRSVPAVKVV